MYGSISSFLSPPLEINNSSRCTFLFNTKESIFANNTHISDIEEKGNKKIRLRLKVLRKVSSVSESVASAYRIKIYFSIVMCNEEKTLV